MREYQRRFEILAAPLNDMPEHVLESNFINGLKRATKAEIRQHQPKGLGRIMDMAQRVEDKYDILR